MGFIKRIKEFFEDNDTLDLIDFVKDKPKSIDSTKLKLASEYDKNYIDAGLVARKFAIFDKLSRIVDLLKAHRFLDDDGTINFETSTIVYDFAETNLSIARLVETYKNYKTFQNIVNEIGLDNVSEEGEHLLYVNMDNCIGNRWLQPLKDVNLKTFENGLIEFEKELLHIINSLKWSIEKPNNKEILK